MEFETLRKDNRKYWIIGIIVIILLASVIFFVGTKAKYRLTQKVNIASGTINWHPPVFSIVSIKTSSDGTNYSNANNVPTSGYTLSNKSYCEVRGVKDTSATISYSNGNVTVNTSNINTKCYLYFDKLPTAKDTILAGKTISTRSSFSSVLTTNTTGKIYTAEDNDGTSYYFAGAVDNNWVKFGQYQKDVYYGNYRSTTSYRMFETLEECQNDEDYNVNCRIGISKGTNIYWRIIRINGDGTIRLIYNGPDQTGSAAWIGLAKYSHKDAYYNSTVDRIYVEDNAYVGYMYGTIGASTYAATHKNTNSSNVKKVIDNWYNTNLNKTGIKEKIDTNAGFCGDRSVSDGGGIGYDYTSYGAYNRLVDNKIPSLKCINTNDLYTVKGATKGNKSLTYPIGLIAVDEASYAGGVRGSDNLSYYLYTGNSYWTMTPFDFRYEYSRVFHFSSGGSFGYAGVQSTSGIRPVINLKADTVFKSGTDGTTKKPYEVV